MTMGPMEAIRLVVHKYGGIAKNDDGAIGHFLPVVARSWPAHLRQMNFR